MASESMISSVTYNGRPFGHRQTHLVTALDFHLSICEAEALHDAFALLDLSAKGWIVVMSKELQHRCVNT